MRTIGWIFFLMLVIWAIWANVGCNKSINYPITIISTASENGYTSIIWVEHGDTCAQDFVNEKELKQILHTNFLTKSTR